MRISHLAPSRCSTHWVLYRFLRCVSTRVRTAASPSSFLGFHRLSETTGRHCADLSADTRHSRINKRNWSVEISLHFFFETKVDAPLKSRNGSCTPDIYTHLPIADRLCS
jgi:hypothetical protein